MEEPTLWETFLWTYRFLMYAEIPKNLSVNIESHFFIYSFSWMSDFLLLNALLKEYWSSITPINYLITRNSGHGPQSNVSCISDDLQSRSCQCLSSLTRDSNIPCGLQAVCLWSFYYNCETTIHNKNLLVQSSKSWISEDRFLLKKCWLL